LKAHRSLPNAWSADAPVSAAADPSSSWAGPLGRLVFWSE
jgi:hypothetical protein